MDLEPPVDRAYLFAHLSVHEIAATAASILDREGIANVLWGNLMLTVWGVPSIVDGAAFIVEDQNVTSARSALLLAGFSACYNPSDCLACIEPRGSPAPPAHVHVNETTLISLFEHSETLPNIAQLDSLEQDGKKCPDIVLASSSVLPSYRPGRGRGRFDASLYPVRVPSAHRLLEGYIQLILRHRYRKYEFFYMAMLTYISEFVIDEGFWAEKCLDPRYEKFHREFEAGHKGLSELLGEYFSTPNVPDL